MKNSADLGGCYPPRPSASVDNTLLHLQNSSYPTQPHSKIANYPPIVLAMKVVATISANMASTALVFLVLSTLIMQVGKSVVSENANTRTKIVTIQPW